jgi:hypothetical protein
LPDRVNLLINCRVSQRWFLHMQVLGTDVNPSFSLLILLLGLSNHGIVTGRGCP